MTASDLTVDQFRSRATHAALFLDFDGVLAPIVDDPAAARPSPGAVEVLSRLVSRLGLVAVVSGRPLSFLTDHLAPEGLVLSGLYGLERVTSDEQWQHPQAGVWRETINDVAARAEAHGPAGMTVERKGASLTLHYRTAPAIAAEVAGCASSLAARSGLVMRDAKMSVELHPPIEVDKGSTLLEMVGDHDPVAMIGDDLGDVAAFAALDMLAAAGRGVLRIVVRNDETPPQLLSRADLVLDDPGRVVELLDSLAG
ncbi:MAG: trehalose-phosphatase [Actinomycetia bacterium]|nr:trehalose-phosphatase [Actinomycetes bacterium]